MKTKPILFPILVILLFAGLFFFFKPQTAQAPSSTPTTEPKTFTLTIKSKKLISGPKTIQVTEGDQVTIKITSDEPEELHLHGYDKSVDLAKDTEAQLSFKANLTGRFPYELEQSKTDIGALEVSPK